MQRKKEQRITPDNGSAGSVPDPEYLKSLVETGKAYYSGTAQIGYDRDKAKEYFQEAAQAGNGEAWYYLGNLEMNSIDLDQYEQVMEYYTKAYECGYGPGLVGQAMLYEDGLGVEQDFAKAFDGKNLEEILLGSLSSYMGIISDKNMLLFFKLLYSERSINPLAAEILVEETDRMIQSTKNFFYALVVHGKMKNESIDTAATAYALTIHSLIDYRMDMMTAGVVKKFGEGKSPVPKEITDYIKWFSNLEELK